MQVCTALSLHQPSAHPGLSLPGYPAIESVFTVSTTRMVYGIIFILFHVLVLQTEWEKGRTQQMRAEQESDAEGTKWGNYHQASAGRVSANL